MAANLISILRGIENGSTKVGFANSSGDRELDDAAKEIIGDTDSKMRRKGIKLRNSPHRKVGTMKLRSKRPTARQLPAARSPLSHTSPEHETSMNALSLIEKSGRNSYTSKTQSQSSSLPILTQDDRVANLAKSHRPNLYKNLRNAAVKNISGHSLSSPIKKQKVSSNFSTTDRGSKARHLQEKVERIEAYYNVERYHQKSDYRAMTPQRSLKSPPPPPEDPLWWSQAHSPEQQSRWKLSPIQGQESNSDNDAEKDTLHRDKSNHAKGNRSLHTHLDMEPCIECGYQVSSRLCNQCGDHFCDSCFYVKHRHGRMRLHTWEEIIPMCDVCDKRTGYNTQESNVGQNTNDAMWYMLAEGGETLGPFTLEIMVGLFRSKRIKPDGMVCMPPSKEAAASGETSKWVTALAAGLHKHGIKPPRASGGLAGGFDSNSALREIFAARVLDRTHGDAMICKVCWATESHQSCNIDENVPVGTKETLELRKAEERAAAEALAEEVRQHERKMAEQRRRVGAAGRIQGWWRGYVGRQWGKRYMSRVRNKRRAAFQKAAKEHQRRSRMSYKLWKFGKCVASAPATLVRIVKGPGLTSEQQRIKDEDKAEDEIRKLLNNRYATRFPGNAKIKPDSNEVLLSDIEWTAQKVIDQASGERKVQRRDRIRFQVGLQLLGGDDFENFEFAFEAFDSQNEFLATLSKKIEGEWDETLPVRVWWCPPITDEEVSQRHSMMKKKKMMEEAKEKRRAKLQTRAALLAERLGEDSKMAKLLKKKAGIAESDYDDDDNDNNEISSAEGDVDPKLKPDDQNTPGKLDLDSDSELSDVSDA